MRALQVCEQWAMLRGEYVTRVRTDSTLQLQLWFSGDDWLTAFNANSGLKTDSTYSHISTDLGIVTAPRGAGISDAQDARRLLRGAATRRSARLAPGRQSPAAPCLP